MATTQINDTDSLPEGIPDLIWFGVHSYPGMGENTGSTMHRTFYGFNKTLVMKEICRAFADRALDRLPALRGFQNRDDLAVFLGILGLTPERIEVVADEIRQSSTENLDLSTLLTDEEVIRGYLRHHPEENIEITMYKPTAVSTYSNKIPDHVNVICYDHAGGIAMSLEQGNLIGYFAIERVREPHPSDYEWDNGFDFEFITPADAEAIKKAGHPEVVEYFERIGGISEG